MVSSKKTHCAYCQKKCSGNVLRYQDRYYHKPCFELEQTEGSARATAASANAAVQQQQQREMAASGSPSGASSRHLQQAGGGAQRSRTIDPRQMATNGSPGGASMSAQAASSGQRAATLPHSLSSPANGLLASGGGGGSKSQTPITANNSKPTNAAGATCAGCRERISDGQALIALDLHWHVWCFKCAQCKSPLHGEYVAKEGRAYCEKDYQRLYGITCVYCKRYITGKVLQAGEAHHFHPSCARCSKCGDPFTPGEEMYLQGEVTWHPRCGPVGGPGGGDPAAGSPLESESQLRVPRGHSPSLSSRSRSRSASPFSYMSRNGAYGRAASPAGAGYADSEAVGDLSRVYTISYLNADPNQGYLRRPVEPYPPKSPQFSRPTSLSRLGGGGAGSDRSRCSSRSQQYIGYGAGSSSVRERSVPRGMYSVLSSMRGGGGSSVRARSPSMMNEEAIALASYPSGQKPPPDSVPKIERDDFPAPPFPYPDQRHHHHHNHHHHQQHHKPSSQHHNSNRHQTSDKQQVEAASEGGGDHEGGRQLQQASSQDNDGQASRAAKQRPLAQERASRPRSREIVLSDGDSTNASEELDDDDDDVDADPQFRKEEEELSKIANGIGKIFLQTLKEREKLRAWKRANLDPRNASRTPSATRELPARLRYENPTNASPSRDLDRPRAWGTGLDELDDGEQSPTRTRSSLGRSTALSTNALGRPDGGVPGATAAATSTTTPSALSSSYGYKVVQSNRSTPRPGYGLTSGPYGGTSSAPNGLPHSASHTSDLSFVEQQRVAQSRAADLLGRSLGQAGQANGTPVGAQQTSRGGSMRSLASSAAHFRRSMPNVAQLQSGPGHQHHLHNSDQPPKLYPYHLLATTNYRLPPGVDRCHLERHLSNEEFQYIFHCDRLDFYRLPEWKRNELKRRARLF